MRRPLPFQGFPCRQHRPGRKEEVPRAGKRPCLRAFLASSRNLLPYGEKWNRNAGHRRAFLGRGQGPLGLRVF